MARAATRKDAKFRFSNLGDFVLSVVPVVRTHGEVQKRDGRAAAPGRL
jgi:hypothetical protein